MRNRARVYLRVWRASVMCVLLLCAIVGCSHSETGRKLAVSIPAQQWLLDSIVGDRFETVSLLEPGSNPETFEPSMRQLISLEDAEMYFTVGELDFERASLGRIRENFPDLSMSRTSRGIRPLNGTHAHAHDHDGHTHDEADPHVWSSLKNARVMARNMYESVVRLDPQGRDYYLRRYRDLDSHLAALDDSVTRVLAPLRGRSFMVWHPSLSYFARDYGLEQLSVETAGKEASPAQFREMLDHASGVRPLLFFTQAEFDSRQARTMASELGVKAASVAVMQPDVPALIRQLTNDLLNASHRAEGSDGAL